MSHSYNKQNLENPLAKAHGMGSAKSGSGHWWMMKISALALIPLMLWFFSEIMTLIAAGASYSNALYWISKPYVAVLMVLFFAVNFYHAALGAQEIILDYIPNKKIKVASLILLNFGCFAAAVAGISAVLFIAFGS